MRTTDEIWALLDAANSAASDALEAVLEAAAALSVAMPRGSALLTFPAPDCSTQPCLMCLLKAPH